jgi:hypothetical protein
MVVSGLELVPVGKARLEEESRERLMLPSSPGEDKGKPNRQRPTQIDQRSRMRARCARMPHVDARASNSLIVRHYDLASPLPSFTGNGDQFRRQRVRVTAALDRAFVNLR